MTKSYLMPSWGDMGKLSVGYEDMFTRLQNFVNESSESMGYPPYNIKKVSENTYVIELAVAGFSKSELEVTMEDGKLTVSGRSASDEEGVETLWKGISNRAFSRSFTLADTVEVKNAELVNGMLKFWLENMLPEKESKKIEIQEKPSYF